MLPPPILVAKALGAALGMLVVCFLGAAVLTVGLDIMFDGSWRRDPGLAIYGCWFVGGVFAGALGYFGAASALSPQGDAWADRPHAKIVGRWVLAGLIIIYGLMIPPAIALSSSGAYDRGPPDNLVASLLFIGAALAAAILLHVGIERDPKGQG